MKSLHLILPPILGYQHLFFLIDNLIENKVILLLYENSTNYIVSQFNTNNNLIKQWFIISMDDLKKNII